MNYFENREERSKKAIDHTKWCDNNYAEEISECTRNTKIFTRPIINNINGPLACKYRQYKNLNNTLREDNKFKIIVAKSDTVSAIFSVPGVPIALNFASYKHPGGMFLQGSSAQEESLCHESYLYNVLRNFDDTYYTFNRDNLNRALYQDRCLYSPNVRFMRGYKTKFADIITCAAPNWRAASKYGKVDYFDNLNHLRSRINFVMESAAYQIYDSKSAYDRYLILGAFGCGVFKQDPHEVARIYLDIINRNFVITNAFKGIIFAIIDDKTANTFMEEFSK